MRVSTSQIFDAGSLGIQTNQSSLFKLQNQLSTGRRILAPEDDPVASAQILTVGQSKDVNAQYLVNQGTAQSQLTLVDTTLTSVANDMQDILERAVQAGNSSLSSDQKGMIATELKERLDDLVSQANTQDSTGLYIFGGFQANTTPFQPTGNTGPFYLNDPNSTPTSKPYLSYQGDNGQRKLQVSASKDMPVNVTGQEVFMQVRDGQGRLTGRSVFDSVKNLIDVLDPNSGVVYATPADQQAAYDQALNDVRGIVDNVSRVRATVGTRLANLDSLKQSSQDLSLQYDSRISDLQDVDYAKTISDLSQQQMQLQAAQLSFKQTSQLSLFNIL